MLVIEELVTSYPDWQVTFSATLPKGRSPPSSVRAAPASPPCSA